MRTDSDFKVFFKEHWLTLLVVMQPVLDIIAYWTRSPDGTVSGYIRLAIMLAMPLYLLLTLKKKKRFIIEMLIIGVFSVLHIYNSYRVGYISVAFDVSYLAKTAQMPILAICLCHLIKNEQTKNQAVRGLMLAAVITLGSIVLAVITGTDNCTYGQGLGISGWVIDDNRCANSSILVTLAVVSVYYSVISKKKWVNILLPAAVAFLLIINGTKACYFSIFAICMGFAVFILFDGLVLKNRIRTACLITLVTVAVISAAVYPITPRCKVSQSQAAAAAKRQNEIERILSAKGYDLSRMTNEEKLADPVVHEVFEAEYRKLMYFVVPNLFDRFGIDRVLMQYNMTTDAAKLIDTRRMKRCYAALLWEESDTATKLVGFEVSDIWITGKVDLENDWSALFYYYGYLGFGLYAMFILCLLYRVLKKLIEDFKGTVTDENFMLILTFALHIGLAQFSGSVLRRPNVSIYAALIYALIYFKTLPRAEGDRQIAEAAE